MKTAVPETLEEGERHMTSNRGAGRPLSLLLGLCLIAACSAPALSPEEQRAREIETYCRTVADAERSDQESPGAGQMDEVGGDDELWQESIEGNEEATKYQAAFAECMKENQVE